MVGRSLDRPCFFCDVSFRVSWCCRSWIVFVDVTMESRKDCLEDLALVALVLRVLSAWDAAVGSRLVSSLLVCPVDRNLVGSSIGKHLGLVAPLGWNRTSLCFDWILGLLTPLAESPSSPSSSSSSSLLLLALLVPVDLLEVAPLPLLLELPFILIVWLATWLVALDCLLELMVLSWLRPGCCLSLLVFAFGLELWLLLVESSLLSSSVCWHSDSSIGLVPCRLEDLFG